MEKNRVKISEKIKQIVKNRGIKYEEIGKKMGITKQGVSWVLNNREDRDWSNKEIEYWCKVLKIEEKKIYELRERVLREE